MGNHYSSEEHSSNIKENPGHSARKDICFNDEFWNSVEAEIGPERKNIVFRFFGDKGYYSDHLPKTKSMFELKPIPSAKGGYLEDGDLFRPTDMINVFKSGKI